ncbi:hypothetical protein N8I74_15870 [Chitiniphilus purpureus]|uniref:Uncharacterized protein n=1 Tax=Chitiniphilus purpureus TaxID=2981137 RepID=A0ABY6DNV2_9NEIS|nr:hypothetical protein [Chitiniphilus sp. CD1]UXY14781.1 hypothetical protein N8I74_15870 [Chitiniphilus sp. CD1]
MTDKERAEVLAKAVLRSWCWEGGACWHCQGHFTFTKFRYGFQHDDSCPVVLAENIEAMRVHAAERQGERK